MDLHSLTEAQVQLLANTRNRAILEHLADESTLSVRSLAERLVATELAVVEESTYEDRLERTLLELHHHRLPKLADAGLLVFDRTAGAVRARSFGDTQMSEGTLEGLLTRLGPEEDDTVRVLEGREPTIRYGRQLADEAAHELFCIYVQPGLLEEECINRGRQAIERGVQVVVGSDDSDVRTLTRDRLPGVTVWEPQQDLLNTPTLPRLGRLVLADRESVMLAVLREPATRADPPDERALVGSGEDNPLVVLVRDLLGSRLDHLDYQSEDFRSELPR